MAGGTRRRGMLTDINVTPLVDIMLVLLIIFMLTANLIARQAIEVDLPRAATSSTPAPSPLALELRANGELRFNGTLMTAEQVRGAIREAVAKDPKVQAVIAGDKDVPHGRIVWLLDTIRSLGVVSFAVQIDPAEAISPEAP